MNPFGDDDDGDEDDVFESDLSRYLAEVDRAIEADHPPSLNLSTDNGASENFNELGDYIELFENHPVTTHAKLLIGQNISLPNPESLDDEDLHMKLWQVIFGLENQRTYLYHTDHLSDRQFYKLLWTDLLNEQAYDLRKYPEAACHIDALPLEGDDHQETWLRFYANVDERRQLNKETPDVPLPPRAKPPHDRDRYLPKRP